VGAGKELGGVRVVRLHVLCEIAGSGELAVTGEAHLCESGMRSTMHAQLVEGAKALITLLTLVSLLT
jgi:hypothetical protein